MWLPKARIPAIAEEMVRALCSSNDIETSSPELVAADLERVLVQYTQENQALGRDSRELAAQRGLSGREAARLRSMMADQRGLKTDEEALDYLLDQLSEMLMHSPAVDEVYAADHLLRMRMREPLRRQLAEKDAIEQEIRGQLKHVQEGSAVWEVEYQRLREQVLRRKGV